MASKASKGRTGALIAQVEFLMPMKKTAKILKMSKASMGSDSASTMEAGALKYDEIRLLAGFSISLYSVSCVPLCSV